MPEEQMRNKTVLTREVSVYTIRPDMGRPLKPDQLRRSKMLPLRLTNDEWVRLEGAARRLGVPVAVILREGADLYIRTRGKDGSRKRKETKR